MLIPSLSIEYNKSRPSVSRIVSSTSSLMNTLRQNSIPAVYYTHIHPKTQITQDNDAGEAYDFDN